jgi:hypothetical protein
VNDVLEEPCALIAPARICEGGGIQSMKERFPPTRPVEF